MCILIYLFIAEIIYSFKGGLKSGDQSHISPVVFHPIFCDQSNKKYKNPHFYFDKDCNIKHVIKPI